MSEQCITVGFGKSNLPGVYASIAAFRVEAPFIRVSALTSGRQDRSWVRDYQVGAIENHGIMYSRRVTHPQGTILLLQSGWKSGAIPTRDAAIFLRLREGATRWEINAKLPLSAGNVLGDRFKVFEGEADILTSADLQSFGIEANRNYREKFMSQEEIDECYIIARMWAERVPRPDIMLVGSGANKRLVEVAKAPQRRLRFGPR